MCGDFVIELTVSYELQHDFETGARLDSQTPQIVAIEERAGVELLTGKGELLPAKIDIVVLTIDNAGNSTRKLKHVFNPLVNQQEL